MDDVKVYSNIPKKTFSLGYTNYPQNPWFLDVLPATVQRGQWCNPNTKQCWPLKQA